MLESLITSKTRLRLLVKFFINIANKGYLNSLANEFGESTNSVRKELNNLSSAGYLEKHNQNNKVIYKANASHPLFKIIQKIVHKHLGIEEILETVYNKIGEVKKIPNQIAYVGRDSYEKGIDILKNAEQKIDGNVIYCTDRSWEEAMRIIKSSEVVVVPSRMESLPTTVKEAFFLDVPVIGTDVGGIPELIINNETGILIPSENPDKLSQAVNELLSNKEKAKKLASNGNIFVKNNMTWDIILPKYIQFYEDLLNN